MDTRTVSWLIVGLGLAGAAAAQAPAPTPAPALTPAQVQALQEEWEYLLRLQMQWTELERERELERAAERCRANRGVDCDTDEGLRTWLLKDRTRLEAVLDGARLRGGALPPDARATAPARGAD
jgi:hypothetical protein